MVALASWAAFAEPEGGSDDGWNLIDPVNIAEGRAWAALYWASQDAGAPTPEFRAFSFTNPISGGVNPLIPAELLFRQIYAHRLSEDADPVLYTFAHLLQDDPLVMNHFRHYTITGELEIAFDEEPEAALNHLLAIADAATDESEFSFVGGGEWVLYTGSAASSGLVAEPGEGEPPVDLPLPSLPQNLEPFDDSLRDRVRDTPLPDAEDLYRPDDKIPCPIQDPAEPGIEWCDSPGQIGFDCDDYTRAIRAWLRVIIESHNARSFELIVRWKDGLGESHIHSVLIIENDGYWYIVDAQTGLVLGPYNKADLLANGRALLNQILRWLAETYFTSSRKPGLKPTRDYDTDLRDFDHPFPGEVPPWYTDPAMRDHFKDRIYIPDDAGLGPYIWDSGVAPGGS